MKKIIMALCATLTILATSCQKENVERVQSLEGGVYRIYYIEGTYNSMNMLDYNLGKSLLLMYVQSGTYTGIKFFPDTSVYFKNYVGDTQQMFFKYDLISHLRITTTANDPNYLVIYKNNSMGRIPREAFDGEYQVIPAILDNITGYALNGYRLSSKEFINGKPRMVIDIALVK